MTDLTPTGDFEPDNLTPDEHERLLLMSEHAIGTPLSPSAQAVLDAFLAEWDVYAVDDARYGIAAAIRELMNQVVPQPQGFPTCKYMDGYLTAKQRLRMRSLTIADELEGLAND